MFFPLILFFMWTEWRLKEWPFLNFWFEELLEIRTNYWFWSFSVPIYVSKPLKHKDNHVIFSFVSYCILAFLMILSLSLYTSHGYHVDKSIISFFGFSRNLREFCAIIQSSLRTSVTGTHRCDEESILWRNAGGSLSLIIKEFMTFVCFWNNPLEVLQGLVGWYLVDSML